ncbi:trichohyalin [Stomoxys calcitrans]|uniref:trichohyalin n=1 Tax=Stomoxys calcitrans TaxID=35570 RepID=UPI0027E32E89|nr:trichohyalin [Stomoxys calcitrans]
MIATSTPFKKMDSIKKHKAEPDAVNKAQSDARNRRKAWPIVLSNQRYNKIINNAIPLEKSKAKQQFDEEQQYLEHLKAGNDQLVAQFKGNKQRTQEERVQQMKDQLEKKTQQAKESYEQTKENEAQKRQEKIAKAQQLIEKLKPGPRDLQTAVLQSEVLRARNVQREINEEFRKAALKQECESKVMCHGQAMSWIADGQRRLTEKTKNTNLYKQELLQTIKENQKIRSEQKTKELKEIQAARQITDSELKSHREKEMALLEKKRETLRKNALEAMKMVEQRRLRDKMVNQVEDSLACAYTAGKRQLDSLLAEQSKKIHDNQQKRIAEQVKKLAAKVDNTQAIENERLRRDISTMQLKFTAEEQEKIRKDRAAKQARIEAHMREMQELKDAQLRADEEKRFEIAQRLKNEEVNFNFVAKERQDILENVREIRSFLDKQIEENHRNRLNEKQQSIEKTSKHYTDNAEQEDKFFFEYARDLMKDAQQKQRPLYPFVKAVQHYKKHHEINCERKVPPHMVTKLTVGRSQPPAKGDKTDMAGKDNKSSKVHEDILQNCLEINEIIAKAEKDQNKDEPSSTVQGEEGQSIVISSKNDNGLTSSAKIRYSMQDLKKLNQYAAPSCH